MPKTSRVLWSKHPLQPPKVGRLCDAQPTFCGENVTHNRWLRQLRRLHHLQKLLSRQHITPTTIDQAHKVWETIKAAPGFPGGFRSFWIHESSMAGQEPIVLPKSLPNQQVVAQASFRFEKEFRIFETSLKKERVAKAKQVRREDSSKIYQDIKKPKAIAVQTIATKRTATIVWVSDDGTQCHYEPPHFDINEAVLSDTGLLQPTVHSPGNMEGLQANTLEEGDLVYQDTWVSSHGEIFQAFEKLWIPMWQKHSHHDGSKWEPFIDSCLHQIPQRQEVMQHSPITLKQWQEVVHSKKSRSAMGPDGVTRQDLISMPIVAQQAIVASLHDIENGAPWPQTCVLGLISSLQKHDRAKTAADYRPICIFSMIYRCWASLRARQMLHWLAMIAPPTLGSCPGRDSASLWYEFACLVEEGNCHGLHWAGHIADLSKCFNNLPRIPVMLLAHKYGIPEKLYRTWTAAITAMSRRFLANGAVSSAHYSCNGFPEGDPLSVVAMMLINLALSEYMNTRSPLTDCWSFVDDWQLTANNAHDIQQGMREMQNFTELLDIPMDSSKSAVWSTASECRKEFREARLPVTYHGRNLGGHLTYCKVISNYTIQARIAKQKELWVWLHRSYAPSPQKALALMVVAWPRCLHGISVNVLGGKHFTKLCTRAVQSLGDHRKGTSTMLHLSCLNDPRADPEFYACWITIKHFRVYGNPQVAFPLIDVLVHHLPVQERAGPCCVFLQRINLLGWTWKGGGFIEDHEQLLLHILHDPIQLIWQRLKHAWRAKVLASVSVREGFQGLATADVARSTANLSKLPEDQKQILIVAMNGTFFTRDKQFASGLFPDKQCPWCINSDSAFHRHWECKHFEDSRQKIPPHHFAQLEFEEECMLQHGWCQESPHRLCLQQKLLHLPDLTREFFVEPTGDTVHHLFTDGSCIASCNPELRIATWGVVIARLDIDRFDQVSQGPLPGLYQTIFRAEATAYISACRYILSFHITAWVWCDNQQLVEYVKSILQGGPVPCNKDNDHDLLEVVRQLTIQAFDRKLLQGIVKVRSHEDIEAYEDIVQQWVIRGNDAADRCAASARHTFDSEFFAIWRALADDLQFQLAFCDSVHAHFIRVGMTAVQEKGKLKQDVAMKWARYNGDNIPQITTDDTVISWATIAQKPQAAFEQPFGDLGSFVLQWLQGLTSTPDSELQWVTFYQLLVDFQTQGGHNGVKYEVADKRWSALTDWEVSHTYEFTRIAQWFGAFLRTLAKHVSETCEMKSRRPTSSSFARWNKCVRMSVSKRRMLAVDDLWRGFGIVPIKHVTSSFRAFKVPRSA